MPVMISCIPRGLSTAGRDISDTNTSTFTMLQPLSAATAVLGSLYRVCCFIFLRIIPTSRAQPILPSLFLAYIISWYFSTPKGKDSTAVRKPDEKEPGQQPSSNITNVILRSILELLTCLPSTLHRVNWANLIINTLLFFAVLDFVSGPFLDSAKDVTFSRVGAISPDSVKIAVRYPFPHAKNASVHIFWREARPSSDFMNNWHLGPPVTLTKESDWVGKTELRDLWPSTTYEYVLVDDSQMRLPYPQNPIRFTTFPDPRFPGGSSFRFSVSSCITPNFPYRGPKHRRDIRGFDLMAETLFTNNSAGNEGSDSVEVHPSIEFLLLLGDFVYADVPVYVGDDREAYRRLYRRNYDSPSFRKIYEHIPIFHTYDDHEIKNNYIGNGDDSNPPYPNAVDAFKLYNADLNYDPPHQGRFYYEFQRGDAAFFVMDTRRYRSKLDHSGEMDRSMLGEEQLTAMLSWLSKVNQTVTFKFIASSVPFTSLWSHDAIVDAWPGFIKERDLLLDAFHSVPNVVVLSGDRHEFAVIKFTGENDHSYPVYEISTSPLNMFYIPFIRTLSMESPQNVVRMSSKTIVSDSGTDVMELLQEIPKEKVLQYLPKGNIKWSTIEVNSIEASRPFWYLETYIDGKLAYNLTVEGVPLESKPPAAVALSVADGLKSFLSQFGLMPNKWY